MSQKKGILQRGFFEMGILSKNGGTWPLCISGSDAPGLQERFEASVLKT